MQLLDLAMKFTINGFLTNFNTKFQSWAGIIVTILGAIIMLAGIWKIGKGFISDNARTNWPMAIGALILGGLLLVGGWSLLTNTSNDVATELNEMGGGTGNPAQTSGKTGKTGKTTSIVYTIDNIVYTID